MTEVLVVTGTGTGVGKTVATAALAAAARAEGRRVAVVKPAQTGVRSEEPGDVAEVRRLAGAEVTGVELARYPEPLAPATAARRSGLPPMTVHRVVDAVTRLGEDHDLVLIEGAGGLLVRFGDAGHGLPEVARALAAPVLVVTAAGLGTLSATELTVEALRHRELVCRGLVVGAWPAEPGLAERCNREDLPQVCGVPLLGLLPAGAGRLLPEVFRRRAAGWLPVGVQ